MMARSWQRGWTLLWAGLLLLASSAASAQVTAEEAGQAIGEAYKVRVLKVAPGEIDGRPVWLVTVMNEAGDFNEAFQVTTLAVDQASGDLVPAFRHRASGYELPPRGTDDKIGQRPDSMRSGTWR